MNLKVLENETDYKVALKRAIELFNVDEGTPESEELTVLLDSVKIYEDIHYPIPAPDSNNQNHLSILKK